MGYSWRAMGLSSSLTMTSSSKKPLISLRRCCWRGWTEVLWK